MLRATVPCGSAKNNRSHRLQSIRMNEFQAGNATHIGMYRMRVATGLFAAGNLRRLACG